MPETIAAAVNFDAIDIAHQKLRLNDDLAVWPDWENGTLVYRLERSDVKRFFRVGLREYIFISLLDGRTTVAAACGLAASRLGSDALTDDEAESIVIWLIDEGIATVVGTSANDASASARLRKDKHSAAPAHWLQSLNPFWIQIPLVRNTRPLELVFRILGPFFHPLFVVAGLCLIAAAVFLFVLNSDAVYASANILVSRNGWVWFLLTWIMLKVIHEAGHAVACHRVGGEPSEIGIVLVLFAPLAYVDVSSCWRMSRRIDRLAVSAAGMFVELSVAAIAMFVWWMSDRVNLQFWSANIVIAAGVSTVLFNANPLMRFDGYYLLSDALGIPNLYNEASLELNRLGRRIIYGETQGGCHYRGWRRSFVVCYAMAALIWRCFICTVLCITAAVMFSGAGIVLSAIGVFAWFAKPAMTLLSEFLDNWNIDRLRFARSSLVFIVLGALIVSVLLYPIPTVVHVAGVVHDPPGSIVRAASEGFVNEIHVTDGQVVRRGDPLMTLENHELREEVRQLELSLEENQVLQRIATDRHDASAEWTARQERMAIEHKLEQMRPKLRSLTIVAPHDGTVASRDLAALVGRFVDKGDELVRVSGSEKREVIGVIHQDRIRVAKANVGESVRIGDASTQVVEGLLHAIDPRASLELPDHSLAASYGGPLAVTASDADRDDSNDPHPIRLTEPHFLLRVELSADADRQLKTGMRVGVRIGYRQDSIARRIATSVRRLWRTLNAGELYSSSASELTLLFVKHDSDCRRQVQTADFIARR